MKARIEAQAFKNMVDNTKKFTGYMDKTRYIYLEVNAEEKELKATAVDGHKVSIEYAGIREADESFNCFILPSIPKINTKDRYVELELVDNKVFVTVGENITGFIQPEGEFFKLNNLLDGLKNKDTVQGCIYIDAKLLKDALDSCKGQYKPWVKIEIRGKKEPVVITKRHDKGLKLVLPVNASEEGW